MRLLVVGAGVAGAAFARLASASGHEVTLVERNAREPELGYAINLGRRGLEILGRLGVLDAVYRKRIPIESITTLDAAGEVVRRDTLPRDTGGPTASGCYVERGVLLDALRDGLEVDARFETRLIDFERTSGGKVVAQLESGASETFDGLVGADGRSSRVGEKLFGPPPVVPLGLSFAFVRASNVAGVPVEAFNMHGVRRMCGITGFSEREVGALMFWLDEDLDASTRRVSIRDLRRLFEDFGGGLEQILAAFDPEHETYADAMGLLVRPRWSSDSVGLIGDAAHCTSPLSTLGAGAALAGAFVLADEMARQSSFAAALQAHERRMRPGVARIQDRTRKTVTRLLSRTDKEALWRNRILRFMPAPLMRSMMVGTQREAIVRTL